MAILLQEKIFGPNVIYYVFVTNITIIYRWVKGNFVGGTIGIVRNRQIPELLRHTIQNTGHFINTAF